MPLTVLGNRSFSLTGLTRDDPYLSSISDGAEPGLHLIGRKLLKPDAVAMDVGANIGVTTLMLSQCVPRGHVHAFEPSASVFPVLRANVAANNLSNVSCHNLSVTDISGEVRFAENHAWGHMAPEGSPTSATSIDDFVRSAVVERLSLIKIDVEGFERAVIEGAATTLARFKPAIYLEFNSWCLIAHSRQNPLEFLEWLVRSFGYVYLLDKRRPGEMRRIEPGQEKITAHDNIVHNGCVDDLLVTHAAL